MNGPDPTAPTESSFSLGTDGTAAFPTDDNKRHAERLEEALFEVKRVIVGQDRMVERAMICLLARGHCLIEGVPGLAKTLTVSTLADVVGGTFTRLQFTPDLVPADIVGTRVWRPSREDFDIEWGPIFANLVLADEINRAPAKVQSALLEVMAERHVSIAGQTRRTPNPFLVLATQNPIESEGVYALPEAQRDRFLMQIVVSQPSYVEELEIARRMGVKPPEATQMLTIEQLVELQGAVDEIFVHHAVQDYAVRLVMATRDPIGWRVPEIAPHVGLGREPARDARSARGRTRARVAARPALPRPAGRRRRRARGPAPPPDPHVRRARRRRHDRRRHRPGAGDDAGAAGDAPAGKRPPGNGMSAGDRRVEPTPRASRPVAAQGGRAAAARAARHAPPRRDAARRVPRAARAGRARRSPARASYEAGDDSRWIDWNLTARSITPQVRTTEADRELQTWTVVDRSASMNFGTGEREKADVAFAAAAAFGFLTARHGNRFGMLVAGGDEVHAPRADLDPTGAARVAVAAVRRAPPHACIGPRRRSRGRAARRSSGPVRGAVRSSSISDFLDDTRLALGRSPGSRSRTRCCACRSSTRASSRCPPPECSRSSTPRPGATSTCSRTRQSLRDRYAGGRAGAPRDDRPPDPRRRAASTSCCSPTPTG